MNGVNANNAAAQTYTEGPSNQVDVIDTQGGRILCVADVRGKLSTLNALAIEHNAKAIIHTGDFGFYEPSSLSRVSERTLKHLIQYSNLITPQFRSQLLAPHLQQAQIRQMLTTGPNASSSSTSTASQQFALSEFPQLLTGELKFVVPVYTVWGACEDVSVLERLRVAPPGSVTVPSGNLSSVATSGPAQQQNWSIPNLTVLSESCSRALVIGNVRFRLFGLGGACVQHKLFDNGEGQATIAGGGGTMWTTMLQIGELVDTAQRVYDPTETRILITHASPGREGMLAQLALVVKADLSISASLHFRYGVSYNEFSVQHDQAAYRNKFVVAKASFNEVWDTVKTQVEAVIDDQQRKFLNNALAVVNRLPSEASPADQQSNRVEEEAAWKNTWNWNLPDAAFGSLVLDVKDGRVSSEMKSQGFNFSYRANQSKPAPSGPQNAAIPSGPKHQNQKSNSSSTPSGPKAHQQQQSQSQQQPRPTQQSQSSQQSQKDQKSAPQSQQSQQQSQQQPVKPAAVASNASTPAPPASTGESKDSAPSGPSLANTGAPQSTPATSNNSSNIDRPNSSASRRPSSQQQKHRNNFSRDENANANATDSEAGNSSAAENGSSQRGFGRGRGRGRGRGGSEGGRGGFDGPKRGRGSYRGGFHQNSGSQSDNKPSDSNKNSSATTSGPVNSQNVPAAKSGDSGANGIGWD